MKSHHKISASRLPSEILKKIFLYINLNDLAVCMRVCRNWFNVLEQYCGSVWEYHARREIPESALADTYIFGDISTFKEKLRAFRFAWNPKDSSKNNFLRTNGLTVHRQPVAQSTDAIRGKIGVAVGIHAWEIVWEGPLGTVAIIGVATKHAAMQCQGYVSLLGSDDQSWGWNLVDNQIVHNGVIRNYPGTNNPPKYQIGERIRMILDCDNHQLYFEKGSEFLGVAFGHLPPVKLYPSICAVYGNTEITLVYIGQPLVG